MIGERRNKKNIKSLDLTRKVNLLMFKALTWNFFPTAVITDFNLVFPNLTNKKKFYLRTSIT